MKSDNSEQLPVNFDTGEATDVYIQRKYKRDLSRAKAMEQFGQKVMRIKMKALAAMGDSAEKLGIKKIGHGKILIAGDTAEEAISRIDELIEQHQEDGGTVVSLMEIRLGYTRLMLDSGKAHIDAEKQVTAINKTANITIPFPAGNPMVVAVKQTNAIEDIKPDV